MRTFRTTDAEAVYSYASDPDVTKLMDWPIHSDLSMSAEFISATKAEWDRNAQYTWAITLKDSQILIGAVSCGAIAHRVSFGYVLSKNAWGKGYATEAAQALISLLEAFPLVCRVWATCDLENHASAKVLEKCGLHKEGTLRSWSVRANLGNKVRDSFVYAKTRGV
jgi:ribosomal-protein-alanine N-acetyltransferase